MADRVLSELLGKTIAQFTKQKHGHYGYTGYIITFTDGTQLVMRATSGADCYYMFFASKEERKKAGY